MTRMIPVTIGEAFGWLHLNEGSSRVAILCPPLGYELSGAHQPLRILADQLADAGVPTLRLDYPGSGDALGEADDDDLLGQWSATIEAAATWMRDTFDAADIALVGHRLGATAALDVAQLRPDISHLVLIAPVFDGKAYVRDLKLTARLVARGAAPDQTDDGLETGGFYLTQAQVAALHGIDCTGRVGPKASSLLMLQEGPSARLAAVTDALRQNGNDVIVENLLMPLGFRPGDVPPPPPLADVRRIVSFLAAAPAPRGLPILVAASFETDRFRETALRFGDEHRCCGILCEPLAGVPRGTMIFLNTGAIHHIGPGRSSVEYARTLAAQGFASFRMDISGIGDASWSAAGAAPSLYDESRYRDVRAALDLLEARGLGGFMLFGVCSGAYLAIRTAQRDRRVRQVFAGNLQIIREDLARQQNARGMAGSAATRDYLRKLISATFWARVARGDVKPANALRTGLRIGSRLMRAVRSRCAARFGVGSDVSRDVLDMFREASSGGTRVHLIYAAGDVGLEEFAIQAGACRDAILGLPDVSLTVLDGCDHTFASRPSRGRLLGYVAQRIVGRDQQERHGLIDPPITSITRWAEVG